MAVTFNGTERFIEVTDPADIVLDAQRDLYSAWKDWQQESTVNAGYAPAFRTFGGDETVTGQNAPRYYFLRNGWRVRINNGQVVAVALNLYSDDFATPYVVVPGSGVSDRNSDAVSVNSEAIEFASFEGGITLDIDNLTGFSGAGTAYPRGTRQQPVNNLDDAYTIASSRGISKIFIIGDVTLGAGDTFERFVFEGESELKSNITIEAAAIVTNSEFINARIEGTLDGNSVLIQCTIGDLNFVDGKVFQSTLDPSTTISLAPGTIANFQQCFSGQAGQDTPTINLNSTGSVSLRDYNGGIRLTNCDTDTAHSLDMASGQIKLDAATITDGRFVCRGVGKLIESDSGFTIRTGEWNGGVTVFNEMLNLITISEASSFTDAVYIDAINGVSGVSNPIGLERLPVNNLADAVQLATIRGTSKLVFLSDFTITATDNISGFEFYGTGWQNQTLTFESGCIVAFCDAHFLTLTGNETGLTGIMDCFVKDLGSVGLAPSNVSIVVRNSMIGGTITFPSNYSGDVAVIGCWAENSVNTYPRLDIGESAASVLISNWNGQVEIENVIQNNDIDIRLNSGEIELSSSVTNANIHAVGTGYLRDTLGNELLTGVWNGAVNIENETITGSGSGGSSPWSPAEKDEVIAYAKKASDNAEQVNNKIN